SASPRSGQSALFFSVESKHPAAPWPEREAALSDQSPHPPNRRTPHPLRLGFAPLTQVSLPSPTRGEGRRQSPHRAPAPHTQRHPPPLRGRAFSLGVAGSKATETPRLEG